MKKKMMAVALMGALVSMSAGAEVYPTAGVVTEIMSDTVTVTEYNGNCWQFDGAEDWCIGDVAALLMEDNNTAVVYDDEIVMARYVGVSN